MISFTFREEVLVQKKSRIIASMEEAKEPPLSSLRQHAISSYGLVSDVIRTRAWPILSELDVHNIPVKPEEKKLQRHKDYNQVLLDVNRSLKRFPPGMDGDKRMAMQEKLVDVIMRVLVRNKDLHYYQGYHDICVTFLLVLDEDVCFGAIEKMSRSHFVDFMKPTMEPTSHLLGLIFVLLRLEAPQLLDILEKVDLQPIFALPWVITWFGHVLGDLERILRVYDFFLATHPLMPIYLSAAIVIHRHHEVQNCEKDFAMLHHLLMNLPANLPLEELISSACQLFFRHPPDSILALHKPRPHIHPHVRTASSSRLLTRCRRLQQKTVTKLSQSPVLRTGFLLAFVVLLLAVFVMFIIRNL